ncbi:MAG: M23 family metallopeptidase, partial [Bacteroidales bacterium]|nr:M23 family metallopeptidase [Bacteroidales bacterium]
PVQPGQYSENDGYTLNEILPEKNSPLDVEPLVADLLPLTEHISCTLRGELQEGDSLLKALQRANVSPTIRQQIISNLASCLDFRRLRPKDHFTIDLDKNDEMIRCSYETDPLHRYTIVKRDDVYVTSQDDIPLEVKTVSLSGSINQALFSSFAEHKVSPRLIYSFADIFASRIDFNTESKPGDTFTIVFEEYSQNSKFVGYGNILYAKYGQPSLKTNYEAFYFKDGQGHSSHYTKDGQDLGSAFIRSPLPMGRLTSKFSYKRKHPILGVVRPHLGIDLAAPTGTPVMAAADGIVVFKGVRGGFGKQIILKHGNGYKTYYGHFSRFKKGLRNGSRVSQKNVIGYVGSTGRATGPHLDYRVAQNGTYTNPFGMNFKPKAVLAGGDLHQFTTVNTNLMAMLSTTKERGLYVRTFILTPADSLFLL